MELTAYLRPGWAPLIRPAPATRPWMDATPESFAYRCLPLNIANAHGWEILSPCGFQAVWDGGTGPQSVNITIDGGSGAPVGPVSLFGQGVVTFHVEAIFRTPAGWNLWAGGSPNRQKDGIAPLTGVIETDWSPFTFTMNWRFTRPNHIVRFESGEAICFLFPVQRGALEAFDPKFESLESDPVTERRFLDWSQARDAFHESGKQASASKPSERWQKHYYRGVDVAGEVLVPDHQSKLHLKAFDQGAAAHLPLAPRDDADLPPAWTQSAAMVEEVAALRLALAKREWLLENLERRRDLVPSIAGVERRLNLSAEEFLTCYYAVGRPVILSGEMTDWPALRLWRPEYLKNKVGAAQVDYQGGRSSNTRFEAEKENHRRTGPFNAFIDSIVGAGVSNDAYMTAYNSAANRAALAPLAADMGVLDKFLTRDPLGPLGMMWIGPAGTLTSLHHDLTNNLIAQVVGRKRVKLIPASEVGRLYNLTHVFSEVADLDDPAIDVAAYNRLAGLRMYDLVLNPGDVLFIPVAWWHQVRALDFSVTVTYTNFRWPNDAYVTYPAG
jgi:hypothetical protein